MNPIKILIIGNGGVGKKSVIEQFCYSQFIQYYDRGIEDSYRKQVVIDNEILIIEFANYMDYWGDLDYMKQRIYQEPHGFIVVYSINDKYSFNELENYLNEIYKYREVEEFPIIIIGNKNDLEDQRVITKEEGEEFANKYFCPFFETSAKTRSNVEETVFTLLREIRKYPFDLNLNSNSNSNSNSKSNSKSNCLIF
ncbi:gtp-binding protein rit2 [Anaeramoeba ignava]|uniref:Gtp-binding protein rit2 n=1 Tax=Anaeramoeba ignava TaxID=1746090 RepID=A0A9Q0RBP3_ANAIG|nr:gtp-binding protein rit2 [Anaeramoeba ignava]